MLWENAIRVRIKRMLSGNIRQQDIGLIFADLRLLQNLPAEVRDLADFAAHRPNRKRGHTPSSVPVQGKRETKSRLRRRASIDAVRRTVTSLTKLVTAEQLLQFVGAINRYVEHALVTC
jgi:hypothetical protein